MTNLKNTIIQTLTLFGSLGTLLCCALPAVLVSVGAGAVMASVVTTFPQLVWLSEHKILLFVFAAFLLVMAGGATYLNRRTPCPIDPAQERSCRRVRRLSASVFFISLAIYGIGFYFAFIAGKLAT